MSLGLGLGQAEHLLRQHNAGHNIWVKYEIVGEAKNNKIKIAIFGALNSTEMLLLQNFPNCDRFFIDTFAVLFFKNLPNWQKSVNKNIVEQKKAVENEFVNLPLKVIFKQNMGGLMPTLSFLFDFLLGRLCQSEGLIFF